MAESFLVLKKDDAVKRPLLTLKQAERAGTVIKLAIADITIGERLIPEDPKLVAQLKTSIREFRQTTPILVRRISDGGYMLVDGLNRLGALKELGQADVSVSVLDVTTEEEAKACEAISNRHRRLRLTALDRALSDYAMVQYIALKAPQNAAPRGGRQPKEKFYAKTARELGVSPDQIARSCKIAKILPGVQKAIRNYRQEDNQTLLLEVAASGDNSVAQVHTLARLTNKVPEPSDEPRSDSPPSPASRVVVETSPAGRSQPPSAHHDFERSEASGRNAEQPVAAAAPRQPLRKPGGSRGDIGEEEGQATPRDMRSRAPSGIDAEPDTRVAFDIPQALRAKIAGLADGSEVGIFGYARIKVGGAPTIDVQEVIELHENESD
ncbi:hypothetical protein TSA1_26735 [Bradyrhizobium nitroreducens]|uniref:ParB-like N-terminal domain-containing protein n=1 Tax=Bradyrhizobium nitroreducens TaxID=709803 RepID=A0A2M6UH62_9BRAD|nr:ParB N-terminal domain-containing protein [Bradyrhizobium nitroreducens]PIT03966.1 hypothetical protein TSA1_26735 [Bradyrhizobium nitroreducens]